jgi:hypothetical protein
MRSVVPHPFARRAPLRLNMSYGAVLDTACLERMGQTGQPRGLTAIAAANYAGCQTAAAFRGWVRRGIMPKPIPGTRRYDRRAIDLALDRLSQISSQSLEQSAYGQWKRQNEGTPQRG